MERRGRDAVVHGSMIKDEVANEQAAPAYESAEHRTDRSVATRRSARSRVHASRVVRAVPRSDVG